MNVRSHLPVWAQVPTQKFLERVPIQGTESSPLTEEGFVDSYKRGAGAAEFAALDEVVGEDSALGRPGLVTRRGLNIHFEGDPSHSRGEFEAVLTSQYRGTEYVTHVKSLGPSYSVLRMVNDDGDVALLGSHVRNTREGPRGTTVSGDFSA